MVSVAAFQENSPCPAWGPAILGSQGVAYLLEQFPLLIQEVVLQEVTEMGVCLGTGRTCTVQYMQVQVLLSPGHDGFHDVRGFCRS